jgi:predicted phage baseplate assembly protein
VQRAAATLRWTGGWYEVHVAVDPVGSLQPGPDLLEAIRRHLYRYRRIGHDVRVEPARYVPLDIALEVCVDSQYLRGHVKAALLDLFGSRTRRDGQPGLFHPDSLSFGEGVMMSRLIAEAQGVAGVESATVTRLERLYEGPNGEIDSGLLPLGPLEVVRLDNDPSLPDNGRLTLNLRGGR